MPHFTALLDPHVTLLVTLLLDIAFLALVAMIVTARLSSVFVGKDGRPSRSSAHFIRWFIVVATSYLAILLIAIAVIVVSVFRGLPVLLKAGLPLPNINAALVVLMGLGTAAYLGKKLLTVGTPGIKSAISPPQVVARDQVTFTEPDFDLNLDGSAVMIDGQPRVEEAETHT